MGGGGSSARGLQARGGGERARASGVAVIAVAEGLGLHEAPRTAAGPEGLRAGDGGAAAARGGPGLPGSPPADLAAEDARPRREPEPSRVVAGRAKGGHAGRRGRRGRRGRGRDGAEAGDRGEPPGERVSFLRGRDPRRRPPDPLLQVAELAGEQVQRRARRLGHVSRRPERPVQVADALGHGGPELGQARADGADRSGPLSDQEIPCLVLQGAPPATWRTSPARTASSGASPPRRSPRHPPRRSSRASHTSSRRPAASAGPRGRAPTAPAPSGVRLSKPPSRRGTDPAARRRPGSRATQLTAEDDPPPSIDAVNLMRGLAALARGGCAPPNSRHGHPIAPDRPRSPPTAPDRLGRDVEAATPGQAWLGDPASVRTGGPALPRRGDGPPHPRDRRPVDARHAARPGSRSRRSRRRPRGSARPRGRPATRTGASGARASPAGTPWPRPRSRRR